MQIKKLSLLIFFTGYLCFVHAMPAGAITSNQINAEVQIVCPDAYGNIFSGSGTIIDSQGIILTNRHVVTDIKGGIMNTCAIGFITSIDQQPSFKTNGNINIASVKYVTSTADMDAAILYLNNTNHQVYPSINIWQPDAKSLQFGDKIEVVGYPAIGGSTITYTTGDFSGFGSNIDGTQNFLKATVPLEHGNSGGAAYDQQGQYIGIPTMVVAGKLNSLSYILTVNSIKNWLTGILGLDYSQKVIQQQPLPNNEPIASIPADVTPPKLDWTMIIEKVINDVPTKQSKIQFFWNAKDVHDQSRVTKYFYYYGSDLTATPAIAGKSFTANNDKLVKIPETFALESSEQKYLILQIQDEQGNLSAPIIAYWGSSNIITRGDLYNIYKENRRNFKLKSATVLKKYAGYFVKNDGLLWYINPRDGKKNIIEGNFPNDSYYGSLLASLFYGEMNINSIDILHPPKKFWGRLLNLKDPSTGGYHFYYVHPKTRKIYDISGVTKSLDGDPANPGSAANSAALRLLEAIAINGNKGDLNKIDTVLPFPEYYIKEEGVASYISEFIKKQ